MTQEKRTNATVVWSPERGWHDDGERVRMYVDERGRLATDDTRNGSQVTR